jgi:hypothetical protein
MRSKERWSIILTYVLLLTVRGMSHFFKRHTTTNDDLTCKKSFCCTASISCLLAFSSSYSSYVDIETSNQYVELQCYGMLPRAITCTVARRQASEIENIVYCTSLHLHVLVVPSSILDVSFLN